MANASEAVVAHGLLNSLAAMRGAAQCIRAGAPNLTSDDVRGLRQILSSQAGLLADGIQDLTAALPDEMADRAAQVVIAARLADRFDVIEIDLRDRLLTIITRVGADVVEDLKKVVWGYDREQLAALDELMGPIRDPLDADVR